jgi:hypothetical protein
LVGGVDVGEFSKGLAWVLAMFSIVVWLGCATTSQVVIARGLALGREDQVFGFVPTLRWLIIVLYIPAAVVLALAGVTLIAGYDAWSEPYVLPALVVWLIPVVVGAVYSLPEYGRLVDDIDQAELSRSAMKPRLRRLLWVNRVELGIVYLAIALISLHVSDVIS